mmetsp:Transcript_99137/g.285101  ORF Transcript_99137/g.285101 Transcript_99137/m.285101 type:complete len:241 (+) Transcript_99137:276-998(+)
MKWKVRPLSAGRWSKPKSTSVLGPSSKANNFSSGKCKPKSFNNAAQKRFCFVVITKTSAPPRIIACMTSVTPSYALFRPNHPTWSAAIHRSRTSPYSRIISLGSRPHSCTRMLRISSHEGRMELISESSVPDSAKIRMSTVFSQPVSTTGRTFRIGAKNGSAEDPKSNSGQRSLACRHAASELSSTESPITPSKSKQRTSDDGSAATSAPPRAQRAAKCNCREGAANRVPVTAAAAREAV